MYSVNKQPTGFATVTFIDLKITALADITFELVLFASGQTQLGTGQEIVGSFD